VKLSKAAKARIKRMTQTERKMLMKAAMTLADAEVISMGRCEAVVRTCQRSGLM